jgi:hypothetical protein
MKQLNYKQIFVVLALLLAVSLAASADEITRTVNESFTVSSEDHVEIVNKFGNVIIKKWNKDVFSLNIEIKAEGKNESKSQQILDAIEIEIQDGRPAGGLSIETKIGQIKGNAGFSVDYEIMMPDKLPMKLHNSFGNIYLGSYSGDLEIVLKYGQLMAEDLENASVRVDFASSKCEIESLLRGNLDLRYSKMEIEDIGDIDIKTQFSELQLENGGQLHLEGRYGQFEFVNVKSLVGNIRFSALEIENLDGFIELTSNHSDGIKLENVSRDFEKIDIDGQFSPVSIGMQDGAAAQLEFDLQFGNLRARGEGITFSRVVNESSSSEYVGHLGRSGAAAWVKVKTKYGNIRFTAN